MQRVQQDRPPNKTQVSGSSPPPITQEPPKWRLLREEALLRGYRLKDGSPNTRRFAQVLTLLGVEIRGSRKERLVCPSEVDAAWSRLPLVKSSPPNSNDDDLVDALLKGGR